MMAIFEFSLPDVGEGLTEATIVQWLVHEGQVVEVDTPLVEIETEKANVELPSPFGGIIREIHCAVDECLPVGTRLLSIETTDNIEVQPQQIVTTPEPNSDIPSLLVGYGAPPTNSTKPRSSVRATPPVRKLARDLNIDLTNIEPTGKRGEITRDDVVRIKNETTSHQDAVKLSGLRKHMARAMVRSSAEAPQATLFTTIDVSSLLALQRDLESEHEYENLRITPFALIARCFVKVLSTMPLTNSSIDGPNEEITFHNSINLGVAVAAPQGLVVPNLKSAEALSLSDFIVKLNTLIKDARGGTLHPQQISGGTVTITNIGALGMETGTPLLNPGEAVILAVGAIERRPWVVNNVVEEIGIRPILQLSLTIDHRILDGSEGAALLKATATLIQNPGLALMYT